MDRDRFVSTRRGRVGEAVASTRIEGTQSTLGEVLSAEAQLAPETTDTREVLNYVRALERSLALLPSLPVSGRLLREMHSELMRGVRGNEGEEALRTFEPQRRLAP